MGDEKIMLVRSLYGDLAPDEDHNYLFPDGAIEGWLKLTGGNPYAAAANACRALAVDQAYLYKYIKTHDLQINGALVAAELRLTAESLDKKALEYESETFEIAFFESPIPGQPEGATNLWGGW